jgi:hypothetical protein
MKNKLTIILALLLPLLHLSGCGHLERTKQKDYPEFILNNERGGKKIPVRLLFDYSSLHMILPMFANILNFDYILKPSSHYKPITLNIEAEYTKKELWDLFVEILENCNAVYTVEGTLITITPNRIETDKHVVKLTKTEKDKAIRITDAGPPKKAKRITREELKAMREKILKKMKEKRQENPNK